MNDGKHGAPFARTPEFSKRRLLQHAVAGAFAAGALVAAPAADARIVSVQMSAPTIAFGGYIVPRRRAVREDHRRRLRRSGSGRSEERRHRRHQPGRSRSPPVSSTASRNPARPPSGKVGYLLNFYILKPENLAAVDPSAHRLRQGDVRAAEPRRQDVDRARPRQRRRQRSRRPSRTPRCSRNSFLMPQGLHDGLERVGTVDDQSPPSAPTSRRPIVGADRQEPGRHARSPARRTNTPRAACNLSYPPNSTLDKTHGQADPSRPPERPGSEVARARTGTTTRPGRR